MIKTAVILSSKFNQLTGLPEVFDNSFQDIERDFKQYKSITAFNRYWHVGEDTNNALNYDLINQFDAFFETPQEYQLWLNSTDIVPTKHILVDISNHPIDNTVTRKAELAKIPEIDFLKNRVTMQVTIKHYRNGSHIPVEIPDIEIQFLADNELQREFPSGSGNMVGEYDLLVAAQDSGMKIWDLAISEIHRNDNIGLINQRCDYDI